MLDMPVKEKEKRRVSKGRALDWVYVFADFEDVLAAVKRMPDLPRTRSSLFEFEGEYYLTLSSLGTGRKRQLAEAVLDEYGELVDIAKVFLSEHGKNVIEDKAIQKLKSVF